MQGQTLLVLGRRHRKGTLHFAVALPDGGTALIPAVWTDMAPQDATPQTAAPASRKVILASLSDLIQARRVIDALLSRLDSSCACTPTEGGIHAAGTFSLAIGTQAKESRVGAVESGTALSAHRESRETHEENPSSCNKGGKR
ncbi:hypothetical protein JW848_02090 [Candidatus Bipolaricaulota bacterium]|nr:hypothetical protein [Candidatus Bipolaricaulota bacterium]